MAETGLFLRLLAAGEEEEDEEEEGWRGGGEEEGADMGAVMEAKGLE